MTGCLSSSQPHHQPIIIHPSQARFPNHHPLLRLTYHLAHELILLRSPHPWTPWFDYLRLISHPDHLPNLIHLSIHRIPQLEPWLRGTEIERLLRLDLIISYDSLRSIYLNLPTLDPHIDWDTYLRAYRIISSRAFRIDNFHTLALVPIADLFDHSDQPDVILTSNDLVCDQCGATQECAHDDLDDLHRSTLLSHRVQPTSDDLDLLELRSLRALVPPDPHERASSSSHPDLPDRDPKVFNTYGKLSNARLMTEYGFMIEANSDDKLHFDRTELLEAISQTIDHHHHHRYPDHELGPIHRLRRDLTALFEDDEDGWVARSEASNDLSIDSAAKLSPELWLTIVYESCPQNRSKSEISNLFGLQASLIRELDEDHSASDPITPSYPRSNLIDLRNVSRSIQTVCKDRLSKFYLPQLTIDELLNLKHEVSRDRSMGRSEDEGPRPRTIDRSLGDDDHDEKDRRRSLSMVIDYSLSERIILRTCSSLWSDLEAKVESMLGSSRSDL